MNSIFFSIISIVKNNEYTIKEMINSVKSQSFKNYEHIICKSNLSTDNTNKIISEHININLKIINEDDNNINRYTALNTALKNTSGKYIMLLHGDDIFYNKSTLQDIYNLIIKNDDKLIFYCNIIYQNKNRAITRKWYSPKENEIYLYNAWKIPHTSLIINKEALNNDIYYEAKYNISSDLYYILNLKKKYSSSFLKLNLISTIMLNTGDSSKLTNFFQQTFEDYLILKKFFGFKSLIVLMNKKLNKLFQFSF